MLKFTNTEKTAAEFNGAYFSVTSPEDWDSIGDGQTREQVKAWLAAGNLPEPFIPPPAPPITVSPWQFRKALNQAGLRKSVEDAVAASNDQNLKDGWEFATEFVRNNPFVVSIGQALGKTEAEMDQLFALAKTL